MSINFYDVTDKGETFTPDQTYSNDFQYLDDKYKNITNVSQIPNYYIKQPNQNTFIFKCSNSIFGLIFAFLVLAFIIALLIFIILINKKINDEKNDFIILYFFIVIMI